MTTPSSLSRPASFSLPVLGFAAFSGTGKTTLLEQLIPALCQRGLRLAVIKHAHHEFDIDQPGKDSYRLRKAGAGQVLISSRYRNARVQETPQQEPEFEQLLASLDSSQLDLVLVEGFKQLPLAKIELRREALGKPWQHPQDNHIIAVACDSPPPEPTALPLLDINDIAALTDFVYRFSQQASAGPLHQAPATAGSSTRSSTESTPASCDTLAPAMLSVEQGLHAILSALPAPSGVTRLPLLQASGCCLAEDILAPLDVPPHTNSAMDGYAIRGEESEQEQFQLAGEVLAGSHYHGELQPGQTVRIMTGAPVPDGADTVVMRELAELSPDGMTVRFDSGKGTIRPGQNVRQAGEDLAKGAVALAQGQLIASAELGLLASLGLTDVAVYRPLRVAVFSSGDEVQAPGEPLQQDCLYDSNRYTLHGLLRNTGCEVIDLGIIEDNQQTLEQTLQMAAERADLVLSSGGVSVGDADYIKLALKAQGEIDFWRINMRPGRPLAFGHIRQTPFFGLPGNPVAVMVSFLQFVEPAIRRLQGNSQWQPQRLIAVAEQTIRSRPGRTEYSRGICQLNDKGQLSVRTTGSQGSGILRSMSDANCLIEVAPEQAEAAAGEPVVIIPLQGRV